MEQTPFDVVVIAPLRGSAAGRPMWDPTLIDTESFDEVFSQIAPRVSLAEAGEGGGALDWTPRRFDDLHPDRLVEGLPAIRALRVLRRAAEDPTVFSAGAAGNGSPFERLIGGGQGGLEAFVRGVVAPHLVPDRDPRQEEILEALDNAARESLRNVLRGTEFQVLEGAWNGVRRVVSHADPARAVRVFVIAATREDLVADALRAGGDGVPPALRQALERRIADGTLAGEGIIVVDAVVGAGAAELALVARLGALGGTIGLPVVADAAPGLVGAGSVEDLSDPSTWRELNADLASSWAALRDSAIAPWVGLVVPRVLGRVPYGARLSPVESLEFEEAADGPEAEAYPWMSGCFVVAEVVAAGDDASWAEDFPAVAHDVPDGRRMRPAVETVLPDRAVRALLDRGLIPLVGDVSRAALALPRIQSVASGGVTPLGGR
jgi:type VI secretion system protein ImpC